MKITKYEHSCLDITDNESRVVIDPGKFSTSLTDYTNTNALVITHVHSDHFVPEIVQKFIAVNPSLSIYTVAQVAERLPAGTTTTVAAGDLAQAGKLGLNFFGGDHEFYGEYQNIGVMVGDSLYYPGDSYTVPDIQCKVLAAPASAPWLRVRDAADFIVACKPQLAFPAHNCLLSPEGEEIHYRILKETCNKHAIDWRVLQPGDVIEL